MKFKADKSSIILGLFHPQKVSSNNSSINPILSNIRIKAEENNTINFQATDTSTSVLSRIKGEVYEPASIIVSGKILYSLISSFPDQDITFELKDTQLILQCEKSKFEINTMNDEDFPEIYIPENKLFSDFEPEIISQCIDKTIFSVSKDEAKMHLTGIFYMCKKNIATAVSTDGHRLSFAEFGYEGDFEIENGIIIPENGAQEVKRLADEFTGEFKVAFIPEKKLFAVKTGVTTVTIKIIDSKFPPYEQVIPKYESNNMVIPKNIFHDSLKRVSLLAESSESGVIFNIKGDTLILEGTDTNKGTSHEEMEVSYNGDPIQIAFNINFLQQIISKINGSEFTMAFGGDKAAALIKPIDNTSFMAVIMPLNI
ncbi:MAG: DNA polymerase III subunit beta [Deltaproteobacteria bacterium]|jgi:DNA polymerase-3 subunit beta|nr:DNA polymerase III subunit beta [Deltaproteobacteria bacterium]